MTIQTKIDAAFADINELMLDRQMAWAERRREAIKEAEAKVEPGKWFSERLWNARIETAGSKAWASILLAGDWRAMVEKNIVRLIAKRDGYQGTCEVDEDRLSIKTINLAIGSGHTGSSSVSLTAPTLRRCRGPFELNRRFGFGS